MRPRRARLEDWYLAVQLLLDHNDRKALSAQEMEDKLSKFLSSDAAVRNTRPRLASELFLRGILRNFWDIDKLLGKVNPGDELQRYARSPMVLSILRVMAYELMWLPNSSVPAAKQSVEELMEKCELRFNHEKDWISSAVTRLCKSFERSHQDSDRKVKLREERKRMLREQGGDVPAARPKATVPGGISKRRAAAMSFTKVAPATARTDVRRLKGAVPCAAVEDEVVPALMRADTKRPKGAVPCAAVEDEAIVDTTPAAATTAPSPGKASPTASGNAASPAKAAEASVATSTTPKAKAKAAPLASNVEEVADEEPAALITLVDDSPNRSDDEKELDGAVEEGANVQVIKDEGKVCSVEDGEDDDNDCEEEVLDECESDEEGEEEEDEEEDDVVELEQDLVQADDDDAEGDADADAEADADVDNDDDGDDEEGEEEPCEVEEVEGPETASLPAACEAPDPPVCESSASAACNDDEEEEGNLEELRRLAEAAEPNDADGNIDAEGNADVQRSGGGSAETVPCDVDPEAEDDERLAASLLAHGPGQPTADAEAGGQSKGESVPGADGKAAAETDGAVADAQQEGSTDAAAVP